MRKSLQRLMLGGLALVSAVSMVNAQTLTQDWKYIDELPGATDARWGTGFGGKVWTNNKAATHFIYWDENGKTELEVGAAGTGLTVDGAGNIIASNAFPGPEGSTNFVILPAGGDAVQPLTVTMPEGATAGRMDFIGRANGNIMSAEGGAVYLCPSGSASVAKIFIANGAQVAEKSKSFTAIVACGTDGVAVPLDNNPEGDNFLARPARNQSTFSYYTDGVPTAYEEAGSNLTAAGDAVVLNGVTYTIEPAGTNYCDGFQIVDRSTNEVVATHEEEFSTSAATPNQNALAVEKVDEYTANIYQYVPGQLVAKYTFALPKPAPALEARNAYAYDIKVEHHTGNHVVSYRLNAPASQVKVQLWADGEVAKEYDGTTIAQYTDENKTAVNNLNTVTIPAADVPVDTKVSFRVAVTSDVVDTPTALSKEYSFWSPYGIAVNNNTDSESFGRIIVTESQTSLPASGYHASAANGGIGIGLYAFDQMMNPIKNSQGTYGFTAGMTMATGNYPAESGGTGAIYDFKRLQYSDDGRLFVSRVNTGTSSLWELDPDNLENPATEIFKGTLGENGYMTTADGAFMAGPATAMAVTGSGNDLKVAIVACEGGYVLSPGAHRVDVYNLGTAKEWTGAPSQELTDISGKYWINSSIVTALFDADDKGLMVGQYRATPTEKEPAYVHVNLATGEEDYKDITTVAGGAGMAWNADKSLMAMATGKGVVGIFTVTKDEDGVPSFNKLYEFNTGCGTNTNAIAFDYANNIYVASNSGELFKSFSLPRESGEVVVSAPSKYDVTISSDEYPAELYIIGSVTGQQWNPADGVKMEKGEEGVYTAQITTATASDNIGIVSVLDADWETVNANRWGFAEDNATVALGTAMPIVKGTGAICIGAVGTFDVTVDLKNMTILVEGEPVVEYPETLYIIGNVTEDVVFLPNVGKELVKDADANVYRAEDIQIYDNGESGYGYFAFVEQLGADEEDWNTVNANRFGPAVSDTEITDGVAAEIGNNGDTSYKAKAAIYDIVVDLDAGTVTLTEVEGGVEDVEDVVAVVAGRGEIRIVGEPATGVSIYGINGQAVALNSNERVFNVAAGVYVVVVDGKTEKVMVR